LRQEVIKLQDSTLREAALLHLLDNEFKTRTLVFSKTKKACHRIAILLNLMGKKVCELHGDMTQQQRFEAFEFFKEQKYDIMVATDLAARGLDIKGLQYVINFELPQALTRYIHRVGRTARAGESGVCATILDDHEFLIFKKDIKKVKDKIYARKVNEKNLEVIKAKIETFEYDIQKIIDQERIEREIRLAEMEVKKAQNMLDYREEIYSRPNREWFISDGTKKKIREESKMESFGDDVT
jgi:ATP-dependent RNA helicase DDX27